MKACRDLNFILGSFEGIPAMFCLTAVVGWAASGPVLDLPSNGLSDAQRDTQGWISRAFGCVLTVSLVLGARRALVRYALWGVLRRAALEQAKQLDKLQAVASLLTAALATDWQWPSVAVSVTGIDEGGAGGGILTTSSSSTSPVPSASTASSRRRRYGPGGVSEAVDPAVVPEGRESPEEAQARLKQIQLEVVDEHGRTRPIQREDLVRSIARRAFRALAKSKPSRAMSEPKSGGAASADDGPRLRPAAGAKAAKTSSLSADAGSSVADPSPGGIKSKQASLDIGGRLLAQGMHLIAAGGGHKIVDHQPGDEDLELLESDFRLLLQDPDLADDAFPYFDASEDGTVSIEEFEVGFVKILKAFKSAKASVVGGGAVSGAMDTVADLLFYLVAAVLILTYADVSVNAIFVPVASIILASSFALGDVISDTVNSFVFVVVVRAFDVGDKVVAEGIRNEKIMQVLSVDILTTTFMIPESGRTVSIPNHVLAGSPIENLKRSPRVTITTEFQVAHTTTTEQIRNVAVDIDMFLCAPIRTHEWKPGAKLTVESIEGAGEGCSQLRLRLVARPRRSWQEVQKIRKLRSELLMCFVESSRSSGIQFVTEG